MFIYYSNYRSYLGPYQLADKLKYLCVHECHREKIAEFLAKSKLNDFFNWIHESLPYRFELIKISDSDIFSFDCSLAPIIAKGLRKLKDKKYGAPFVSDDHVPDNLKSINAKEKENEWDVDEFWFDRWDYVLHKMIWSFENYNDSWRYDGFISEEDIKEHDECIKEGIQLFAYYYQSLWY